MATVQIIPQFQEQAFGSGVVNASTASAVAPAVSGQTFYMTGIDITTAPPNAAASALLTVTGIKNGSLLATVGVANTSPALLNNKFEIRPPNPIGASAPNTVVNASLATLGTGAIDTIVTLYGFYAP